MTQKKASTAKKPAVAKAPAKPAAQPRPVEYPPRDVSVERPEIVAPEPVVEEVAPEPPASPTGLFFVTDLASFGPVKFNVDAKPVRIIKGELYPFENTAEIGRLLTKGVIRMATDKDKRAAGRSPEGPGGSLTSAAMAGIGIKRQ